MVVTDSSKVDNTRGVSHETTTLWWGSMFSDTLPEIIFYLEKNPPLKTFYRSEYKRICQRTEKGKLLYYVT